MGTDRRICSLQGFTLIELMVAVCILGILSAVAIPVYQHFTKQAKMVEAQSALHELEGLEDYYYSLFDTYTDDLDALGFAPIPRLQYYTILIELKNGGLGYDATASATLDASGFLDAWVLTKNEDASSDVLHGCIPKGQGKGKGNFKDKNKCPA